MKGLAKAALAMSLLLSTLVSGGCGGSKGTESLSVVGSSSVEPLMTQLSDQYHERHPQVEFDVQATGSSAGIKSALAGTADIGMSSRALSEEESSDDVQAIDVALDGIAVVVNRENSVSGLTVSQLTAIFSGEIRNWRELGGPNRPILLVSREAGSGTRDAFEEMVGLLDGKLSLLYQNGAIYCDSTNAVAMNVADKGNAIGYVSLGSLTEETKAVDINDVACTEENIQNGSYPLARPFTLLVNTGGPDGGQRAMAFVDYVLGPEGQSLIREENFVPVAETP